MRIVINSIYLIYYNFINRTIQYRLVNPRYLLIYYPGDTSPPRPTTQSHRAPSHRCESTRYPDNSVQLSPVYNTISSHISIFIIWRFHYFNRPSVRTAAVRLARVHHEGVAPHADWPALTCSRSASSPARRGRQSLTASGPVDISSGVRRLFLFFSVYYFRFALFLCALTFGNLRPWVSAIIRWFSEWAGVCIQQVKGICKWRTI